MRRSSPQLLRYLRRGAPGLAAVSLLVAAAPAEGQAVASGTSVSHTTAPTFTRDVAPILQRSCQECHQPGGIGPMALVSYEEVRPWARAIRSRVEARTMPPWHLDRTVGIQEYKNDISLTEEEIATIVRWVEAGVPKGDPNDMPAPVEWPDYSRWRLNDELGEPHLIIRSTPYTVVANGQDQWWYPLIDIPVTEPRWIRAVEVKPSYPVGRQIVHHANAELWRDGKESGSLAQFGIGKTYDLYAEDTGKLVQPGDKTRFRIHYFPIGVESKDDVVEIGLWFYPEGYKPRLVTPGEINFAARSRVEEGADILIPPHSVKILQGTHVLKDPLRIDSFRAHIHMRGKAMAAEAIYPDGKREVLWKTNNFHQNWHTAYQFADHVAPLLPRGTVLVLTTWYDNTANNPFNPDPDQWVTNGGRSVDEMSHAWTGVTYLTDEDYERLVAERKRLLEKEKSTGGN